MLSAEIASILFPDREDNNAWDSSSLFRDDASDGAGSRGPTPIVLVDTPTIEKDDRELSLDLATVHPSPEGLSSELSWATAARDSAEGVHYVRENFPSEHSTYLSQPFRREPIAVTVGERVAVLEELSEYAVRVRSLRDGRVGVVPSWNIEDALERLARLNMELNEIVRPRVHVSERCADPPHLQVTSPDTDRSARGAFTTFSNSSFLYRRDAPFEASGSAPGSPSVASDDDMADLPATPTTPATVPRIRRVEFAHAPQKTVFRYIAPVPQTEDGEDGEWWWDGWEERDGRPEDGPSPLPDSDAGEPMEVDADEGRLGRPRVRRTDASVA